MDKVLEMLGYNIGRDSEGRKIIDAELIQSSAETPDTKGLQEFPRGNIQEQPVNSKDNQKPDVIDGVYSSVSDSPSGDRVLGDV